MRGAQEVTVSVDGLAKAVKSAKDKASRSAAVGEWMGDEEAVKACASMDPDAIRYRLSGAGLPDADVGRVLARIRREASGLRVATPDDEPTAGNVIDYDGEPYRVPLPYAVVKGRIVKQLDEGRAVGIAHREIFVSRRWRSEDGDEVLDVVWRQDGGWAVEAVPRGVVMDARGIMCLAAKGAPVDSGSASNVVQWLSMQAETLGTGPGVAIHRQGWVVEDGQIRDYIAGTRSLLGGIDVRPMSDSAGAQIAADVRVAGEWEQWVRAVGAVSHRPQVMVAVWASVAAALLLPLGVDGSAVVHWAAGSSQGKTTSIKLAASVWGDPLGAGLVGSWDATAKKIEESAAFCSDMPLILDETSHVPERGREAAARMIYALANGRGRGRGTRGGAEAVATYRTLTLSTGEAPLTSWCTQEGIAARALEIEGPPCESADQSDRLVWAVCDHYGHLGRRVVEAVARWDQGRARERYRQRVSDWRAADGAGGVGPRLGAIVALLEAAGRLCERLGVPGDVDAITDWIWARTQEQARSRDETERAWELIEAMLVEHADAVQADGKEGTVRGGCIARRDGDTVSVSATKIRRWLTDNKYDANGIIARWVEQGRAVHSKPYLLGERARCLTFKT